MLAEDENNCFNKIRQTLHTMKMMIYIYPSKFSKHKRYSSLFMDDEDDNLIKIRQILQRQQTLTTCLQNILNLKTDITIET